MIAAKLKDIFKSFLQKLIITFQLYGENGLANHAAACAYGFLFSMAPMLLLTVIFIFYVFKPSPQAIISLVSNIPLMENIFDEQWLTSDLFSMTSMPGISGILSVLGILWAARILALSMKRGLLAVFSSAKYRNPVINTLVTVILETGVLIFILIVIVSSRTARNFLLLLDFMPQSPLLSIAASQNGRDIINFILMGLAAFIIYYYVPAVSVRKFPAFMGALLFIITSFFTAEFLDFLVNTSRISFLYGALENIILLLVNVYFFFTFFFLGAQFAYVIDSFDALLFSKLRQVKKGADSPTSGTDKQLRRMNLLYKLCFPVDGSLKKYLRKFKKNDIIITQGDTGDDIYYLVEGEVEILFETKSDIKSADNMSENGESGVTINSAGILSTGSFFGEMGYLLSEDRSATVIARTDVVVFSLPPSLFDTIIRHDTDLDIEIIEHMTRRLKNTTQQIIAIKSKI
ncbi:MAG: YihY/virulence factor BrkB family protein [Treponema sp.]|nr:YihY/virulence factor BrkB family protein [Treponema sp.]